MVTKFKVCLHFLIVLVFTTSVYAEEPLFIYKSGKKFGFIDQKGTEVIEAKYVAVKPFEEGLAAINVNDELSLGLWGYIDRKGKMLIEPQYWLASSFSEGLAGVLPSGGTNWSYINPTGQVVFDRLTDKKPFIYGAQSFNKGIACVEAATDRTAFKRTQDLQGKKTKGKKGMWGFVDKSGKVIALKCMMSPPKILTWSSKCPICGWFGRVGQG